MTAPNISLPVSGTAPNQYTTRERLEQVVNAAFAAEAVLRDAGDAMEAGLREDADAAIVAALSASGVLYASAADGIAATDDGELFVVAEASGLVLYSNDAGTADNRGGFGVSAAALMVSGWKPRAAEPSHSHKLLVAGTWYSPDPVVITLNAQSNGAQVAAAAGGDVTPSDDVMVWDHTAGEVVILNPNASPFAVTSPARNYFPLHAGKYISQRLRRPVVVIPYAVSGSAIGSWMEAGANWPTFAARVEAAFAAGGVLEGLGTIDVHIVDVVESAHDALISSLSQTVYPDYIEQIRDWSRTSERTQIIAVEALPQSDGGAAWRANEGWRRTIASGKFPGVYLASAAGLTAGEDGTDVHFDGASLVELGHRIGQIVAGDSIGATDAAQWIAADVSAGMIWDEQLYIRVGDFLFGDASAYPNSIELGAIRSGLPVVFEQDGAFLEVVTGATNKATFEVSSAAISRVTIWYPAMSVGDDIASGEYPGIEIKEASGVGALRAVRMNPNFPLRYLFLQGHGALRWSCEWPHLPLTLTALRVINCPGVRFDEFCATEIPRGLTILGLNGSGVPIEVAAAIVAENTLRGGSIAYTAGHAVGDTTDRTWASLTQLSTAVAAGYTAADGTIARISDTANGTVALLMASAGAPAVAGVSPAGWVAVRIDDTSTDDLSDFYVPHFATRAAFVSAVAGGFDIAAGKTARAAGLDYARVTGSTAMADLPGWEPVGGGRPEHYGATGDGTANDEPELRAAMAGSVVMRGTTGAIYALTSRVSEIAIAAGTDVDMAGAVIRQDYNLTSDGNIMSIGAGATVRRLDWQISGTNAFERGIVLNGGVTVEDISIVAETPFVADADDLYDAGISVRGAGVTIRRAVFDGLSKCVDCYEAGTPDTSGLRITDVVLRNYRRGINLDDASVGAVIDGVRVDSIHPSAATDPGQNVITGGAAHMIVRNVHQSFAGRGSGEHYIYSSVDEGTPGAVFEDITSQGSGQCFIKLRGHEGFSVSRAHGRGASYGNTSGTNEDGFRFEYCRDGIVSDYSMRDGIGGSGTAGYAGIVLASTHGLTFRGGILEQPQVGFIGIYDDTNALYPSYAAGTFDLRVIDLTTIGGAAKPLLLFGYGASSGNCTVGNITITGLVWDGPVSNLYEIASGVTLVRTTGTRILITGTDADGTPFRFIWAAADPSPTITNMITGATM